MVHGDFIPLVSTSAHRFDRNSPCPRRKLIIRLRKPLMKKTKKTSPVIIASPIAEEEKNPKPEVKKLQVLRLCFKNYVIFKKETTTTVYPRGSFWVGEQKLGEGGYGVVYLVRTEQQHKFASLFPSRMANKTAPMEEAETLQNERRILSEILTDSPCVVRCYGDEITNGRYGEKIYNLFLEYCSGGSLGDRIQRSTIGLPEHEVKRYTKDIVRGLRYIHHKKIAHLDIKPDNVLLVPINDYEDCYAAKLTDFGLCKNLRFEMEESLEMRGTLRYMSPETVKYNMLSYPSDIWALGCSIVEMITGQPVWDDEFSSKSDEILKLIGDDNNDGPEIPSGISEQGRDFLCKCFIRNPRDRWTAKMLLQHPFLSSR